MAMLIAASAHGAVWDFTPTAALAVGYEDNVRMTPHPVGSESGSLMLHGKLQRLADRLDVGIEPHASLVRYRADEAANRDDLILDAWSVYKRELSEYRLSVRAVRDTTRSSELPTTGVVDVDRRHEAFTSLFDSNWKLSERWQLESAARWAAHRYDEASHKAGYGERLFDYDFAQASAMASYSLSERIAVGMNIVASRQSVDGLDLVSNHMAAGAMLRAASDERWTLDLTVSPSRIRARGSEERGIEYTAALQRRGERSRIGLNWLREVTPSASGALTESNRAGIDAAIAFTPRVAAQAAVQWVRTEELFPAFGLRVGAVRYVSVSSGIGYQLTPTLALTCNVEWVALTRDTSFQQTEIAAQRFSLNAGIRWNGLARTVVR